MKDKQNKTVPPKSADRFLGWFCKPDLREEVEGDLHEFYQLECAEKSPWKAYLLYWYHVLHFLRPFAIKNYQKSNTGIMFSSYFKYAFRHIRLNLFFSFINVIGLGIGLAACILIFEYLSQEWSYDKFHPDHERVYRVWQDIQREGILVESATTFSSLAPVLKQRYPFVDEACRLHKISGNVTVEYGEKLFLEDQLMGVDSNFFQLFNFPFLYGSPETALKPANSIVITEAIAQKYFGNADPMGKEIILDGAYGFWGPQGYEARNLYTVTGVIKELPANTHFDFDFLISFNLYANLEGELKNWGDGFYTYLRLSDPAQKALLSNGLAEIAEEYRPGQGIVLGLQQLSQIHLNSNLVNEIKPNGNEKVTWLLSAVAVIILLIAGTNYINFSTARVIKRQDEAGVRKIFGARPAQLFRQLQVEAFVLNSMALLLCFLLIGSLQGYISDLLGFKLADQMAQPGFWLIVMGTLLVSTFISGWYPAFHFSRQKLGPIIGRSFSSGLSQRQGRKSLVVFQFAVSTLVIGCALILYSQMNFMSKKDLGINMEKMLVVNGPSVGLENDSLYDARLSSFKEEAERLKEIEQVTLANFIPGKQIRGAAKGYVRKVGDPEDQANSYSFTQIDFDFIPSLDIALIAGRTFDPSYATDEVAVVINKEACRLLGFASEEEAIGKKIIYRMNSTPTIIGVIDNFHQYTLQRNFQPIIFEVRKNPKAYVYLNYSNADDLAGLNALSTVWKELFPGNSFTYFFLDDFYNAKYSSDQRFLEVFGLFALLAVFVSSMGFFGLIYYTAANKVKEIGIRKTFGAKFWDIYLLLSKGLALFILVSALISMPLIYYVSENWLLDYAFRINIEWWMLLAPVLLLILVSVLLITIQSIRSYQLNPVTALREK